MGALNNGKFIPQWQIDGKRRPLPGICEAIQRYGADNVYFSKPQYVPDRHCPWCGKEVENKRRVYCCEEHARLFQNATVWQRGRGAYGTQILYRDNFSCQDCGEFHALKIFKTGIHVPASDGELEIHHILPVSKGGGDEPTNLITLCKKCHKKRHSAIKED